MSFAAGSSDAPSPGGRGAVSGFPGHGEGAPLDLSDLTPAGEQGLIRRLTSGTWDAFAETAAAVGYCARPIRLVGSSVTVDRTTGEVVGSFSSADAPLGVLHRPCGNRREEECRPCSRVYARDQYAMVHAGIAGGKTVPDSVAGNPLLFITLTAPSFGPVHGPRPLAGSPTGGRCRPRDKHRVCAHGRPVGCSAIHGEEDPRNGSPLCVDCYDVDSAVVWQWWSPELWRRTVIAVRRGIAARLGVSERKAKNYASLQYAKVAEYQQRGLVHFHGLLRLDGGDGPGSPAPVDGRDLELIVRERAPGVDYAAPGVDADDPVRVLAWGPQLDVRVVRPGNRTDDPDQELTADQVAGYLAKYATKDANSLRSPDDPRPHLQRMRERARALGKRALAHDPVETPYRLLAKKWVNSMGFRGHFSTKSRAYSITLGRLRGARQRYRILAAQAARDGEALDTRDLEDRLLAEEEDTTLVIGSWAYQGTGWTNPGDEALALAAAARAREYAQWKAEQRKASA